MKYNPLSGDWQHLDTVRQTPRYQVIANLVPPGTVVLDIGCGTGILFRHLRDRVGSYTGLEPSEIACEQAVKSGTPAICEFADSFVPPQNQDCVIFNEMLYYSGNPIGLLRKYAKHLTNEGRIIISIYQRRSRIGSKARVLHWLDRRRPMSNIHCTELIRTFIKAESWAVLSEQHLAIDGSDEFWWISVVRPAAL